MRYVWNALLLGLPGAIVCRVAGGPDWLTFLLAVAALLPLARGIGVGTEHVAARLGAGLGGLLNATFGNAAELILTILALRQGLVTLVKASITGSIIGNSLLIVGCAAIVGGVRHGPQEFPAKSVGRHAAMMILALSAMALPAVFARSVRSSFLREEVSIGVSILLLATYAAYLYYSYFSRDARRGMTEEVEPEPGSRPWPVGRAVGLLAAAVVGTVVASELLVKTVEPVSRALGLSEFFLGLVVIPIIGNVAEHYSAIDFAARGRMDVALSIAANSSTQIAVFVAPLLVLVSLLFHPMNLIFAPIELASLSFSAALFAYVCLDGETNWLEGVQLLAVYAVAAVAFFFLPAGGR